MLGICVNFIALVSTDVERTIRVLSHLLSKDPVVKKDLDENYYVFPIGQAALAVFPHGHAYITAEAKPGINHIEIGVNDPSDWINKHSLVGRLVAVRDSSDIYAVERNQLDGIDMRVTTPTLRDKCKGGYVERIDHLGIASIDVAKNENTFAGRLGLAVESRQTDMEVITSIESFTSDKYGVVYHARPPQPIGGLRVIFISMGDFELEFLANFNPNQGAVVNHGTQGSTKQDQGAITRYVQTRGEGLHHLALKVVDIDAALSSLRDIGVDLIDQKGRPGSRRARIGFIHPKSMGGILVHLVERDG